MIDEWAPIATILDAIPIPLLIIDLDGKVQYWNEALTNFCGLKADQMIGTDGYRKMLSEKKVAEILSLPAKHVDASYGAEFVQGTESGRWVDLSARVIKGISGSHHGIMVTMEGVPHFIKIDDLLNKSGSPNDEGNNKPLHGLFGAYFFKERLEAEIDRANRYGDPLALIKIELCCDDRTDAFIGRLQIKDIVMLLAGTIQFQVRKPDIPCRSGEGEFSIILPHTTGKKAVVVAERIRDLFVKELKAASRGRVESPESRLTISIGVTQLVFGESAASFLQRANENKDAAKKNGGNQVFFAVDSFG